MAALAIAPAMVLRACPFCAAALTTLSEDIQGSDAAVIAKLVKPVAADVANGPIEDQKSQFEIVEVLRGQDLLGKTSQIDALYFGDKPVGSKFLITGIGPEKLAWATPVWLSDRAAEYVSKLVKLPANGIERLAFIQDYFQDSDPLLANDAYDEFSKVPYSDILALKDKMHRDKLLGWIKDPETPTTRRRLYLTMLSACGTPDDVDVLEELIAKPDKHIRTSLDALVACYMSLKGPEAMPLVEDLFLKNKQADYVDTYAVIQALRFHGQETKVIPQERLKEAMRYMLDRPNLADLVIPDLARWEDWSVMDRMVELFKNANEDSEWVRVPVINYLKACPLPEAKQHIDELTKIDPEAVKRAGDFLFPPGSAVKPPPGSQRPKADAAPPADTAPQPKPAATPAPPPANSTSLPRRSVKVLSASAADTPEGTAITPVSATLPVESAASENALVPTVATFESTPDPTSASFPATTEPQAATEPTADKPHEKSTEELTAALTPPALPPTPRPLAGARGWVVLMWASLAIVGVLMLMLTILRSDHRSRRV